MTTLAQAAADYDSDADEDYQPSEDDEQVARAQRTRPTQGSVGADVVSDPDESDEDGVVGVYAGGNEARGRSPPRTLAERVARAKSDNEASRMWQEMSEQMGGGGLAGLMCSTAEKHKKKKKKQRKHKHTNKTRTTTDTHAHGQTRGGDGVAEVKVVGGVEQKQVSTGTTTSDTALSTGAKRPREEDSGREGGILASLGLAGGSVSDILGLHKPRKPHKRRKKQRASTTSHTPTVAGDVSVDVTVFDKLAAGTLGGEGGDTNTSKKPKAESDTVKVKEMKTFVGETIVVEKEIAKNSAEAKKLGKTSHLKSLLNTLKGKNEMTVLDKTRLDWDANKKEVGDAEELKKFAADGYVAQQEFLASVEQRTFEKEIAQRQLERLAKEKAARKQQSRR